MEKKSFNKKIIQLLVPKNPSAILNDLIPAVTHTKRFKGEKCIYKIHIDEYKQENFEGLADKEKDAKNIASEKAVIHKLKTLLDGASHNDNDELILVLINLARLALHKLFKESTTKEIEDLYSQIQISKEDTGFMNQNIDMSTNNSQKEPNFRDFNLLLLLCESGNSYLIDSLLKYENASTLPNEVTKAQNLAAKKLKENPDEKQRYSNVILKLLHGNLTFPNELDINDCSEELKTFVKKSNEFHEFIENDKIEKLKENIEENHKLRYFYNLHNKSALLTALEKRKFEIYNFFIEKNLSFGPDESIDTILSILNYEEKQRLQNNIPKANSVIMINNDYFFEWTKLPEELKEKILTSNVNFQGFNVSYRILYDNIPKSFEALNIEQIKRILYGDELSIGKKNQISYTIYIDRKFIVEDLNYIYFAYNMNTDHKGSSEEEPEKKRKRYNFENYLNQFLLSDVNIQNAKLDGIIHKYPMSYLDMSDEKFSFSHKNNEQIIKEAEISRILILSSEAGSGKTVSFENLAVYVKQKYPEKWISYINLAEFTKYYKKDLEFVNHSPEPQTVLKKILNLSPENKFEMKTFDESYGADNCFIFWNGFDEISPTFNKFILELMTEIYGKSKNIQFVCTRPLYSKQLMKRFKIRSLQLLPFNENAQKKFLENVYNSQNIDDDNIKENILKSLKIIEKLNSDSKIFFEFNSPRILTLIAQCFLPETPSVE